MPEIRIEVADIGKVSDGSHTFNELYYHRMMLFAVICNTYKDVAWKSWVHDDGTMYADYFIVGVVTPEGDYTYHYHKDHWDTFDVKEVDKAPKWDGHTSDDITRLLSLKRKEDYKSMVKELIGETIYSDYCNGVFGSRNYDLHGAKIVGVFESDGAIVVEVKKTDNKYDYGYFSGDWKSWKYVYEYLYEWISPYEYE